jgi:hypothetical protein
MSQRDKPPSHLKQRLGFHCGGNASGWVGLTEWLGVIEIGDNSLCAIVSLKEIEMSSQ